MGSPHGAPATRGGLPNCSLCAESARSNAPRSARSGWRRLRPTCPAGWSRSRRASPNPMVVARSCSIFPRGSCVATGSASSAPTAPAKTTLLNLLTGALMSDTGEVRIGTSLAQMTLDQRRESLDPEQSLTEALTSGSGDAVTVAGRSRHVVGYMKDFLFRPEQARTPVGVLSGGERARLTLARAFVRPSNLLMLDEPTNDLDLETLDLLQERLAEYPGTVLLVSHDRDFLDRVVTSVIATEGNGRWIEYAGG
jgi:ABC-type transport system involved in cytochrome c biogenesis ATPase subunit